MREVAHLYFSEVWFYFMVIWNFVISKMSVILYKQYSLFIVHCSLFFTFAVQRCSQVLRVECNRTKCPGHWCSRGHNVRCFQTLKQRK